MPFNGSGVFTPLYSWAADKAASVPISSTHMDGQDNDIAAGFNNALTRDNQGKPSTTMDWNAQRLANMADGAAVADAATMRQLNRVAPVKNYLINSDFRIWQRLGYTGALATAPTVGAGQYLCDRWFTRRTAALNYTVVQDNTIYSSAPCATSIKLQRTAADASLEPITIAQSIDARDALNLQQFLYNNNNGNGNYVQFSCYLYKGANFSGANMTLEILYNTNQDRNAITGAGWVSLGTTTILAADLIAGIYGRASIAVNGNVIVGPAKGFAVKVSYTPTGVAGADDSFHLTGCLLEATSWPNANVTVPTTAQNLLPAYPQENAEQTLARCERYYQKSFPTDTAPADGSTVVYDTAVSQAANAMTWGIRFRTRMRAAPTTFAFYRPNLTATAGQPAYNAAGVWTAGSASGSSNVDETGFIWTFTAVSAAGQVYGVGGNWVAGAEF